MEPHYWLWWDVQLLGTGMINQGIIIIDISIPTFFIKFHISFFLSESLFALWNRSTNLGIQPWLCATILHVFTFTRSSSKNLLLLAGTKSCASLLLCSMSALSRMCFVWSILLQVRILLIYVCMYILGMFIIYSVINSSRFVFDHKNLILSNHRHYRFLSFSEMCAVSLEYT